MKGNVPATEPTLNLPARLQTIKVCFSWGAIAVDGFFVATLTALATLQAVAYGKAGLSYSPDSGFYLLYAARLHHALDYSAGAAMYAPLFSAAIALAMIVSTYPGQAAVVVLGVSSWVALVGSYGAARASRTPPVVAVAFALLLFALPSTRHVFGFAWTEGMMLAVLVLTAASYTAWQAGKARCFWLMLLASAAAPLIKYVAIFVPVVTMSLVALHYFRRPEVGGRWRALCVCVLMFLPAVVHGGYNFRRWGTITGHAPAKITLAQNFRDLWTTIVDTLGTAGVTLVLGSIALGLWVLLRARRSFLAAVGSPLTATLAYGLGYFLCLGIAASTAQVDPVDRRLAAPGFGPMLLAAAQGVGTAYSAYGLTRATRCTIAFVTLAACLLPAGQGAISTYDLLRHKFEEPSEPVAAHNSGFGASASRRELSQFYSRELSAPGCVSVTMLNAESPPGRVRREWFAITEALAASPLTSAKTKLAEATRERIAIRTAASEPAARLIFVPGRMPELQRIRVSGRAQRDEAVRLRTAEVMTRIAEQARKNGCARHWVIVPGAAEWFRIDLGASYAKAKVTDKRVVGAYKALLLNFPE